MSRQVTNWINTYLDFVDQTEPPLLYKKWAAVSCIAACLQRKCYIDWDPMLNERLYPNMFIILVGPAAARKGTAMGSVKMFLKELGIQVAADACSKEALLIQIEEAKSSYIDPVNEAPISNCSLTIFSPELTVFFGYDNKDLVMWMTDWYDCADEWKYKTKGSGQNTIHGMWVNILGATTPASLQEALPPEAIGGGLTSRMIMVYGASKAKTVAIPNHAPHLEDVKKNLILDLEAISLMVGEFKCTKEFLGLYKNWYEAESYNPTMSDYRFDRYIGRRQTHLRKLAMIMSAARGDDMLINQDDFFSALELLNETEQMMPYVFQTYGRQDYNEILGRIMATIGAEKVIYRSQLIQTYYRDIDLEGLDKILMTLAAMDFVKLEPITLDEQRRREVRITYIGGGTDDGEFNLQELESTDREAGHIPATDGS